MSASGIPQWNAAINLSSRLDQYDDSCVSNKVTPDSGNKLWQDVKIKVDSSTYSTNTLGLLHVHHDAQRNTDLRGIIPERIPLDIDKIKTLRCDRVIISRQLDDTTHVSIRYLGLNFERREVEKARELYHLKKNQFKFVTKDSYSGESVERLKTFDRTAETSATPIVSTSGGIDSQRASLRRTGTNGAKPTVTKRTTVPVSNSSSSYRAESSSQARSNQAFQPIGLSDGDFEDFYLDDKGVPQPLKKSFTDGPGVKDMYSYGLPDEFIDDDMLRSMGILSIDSQSEPFTQPVPQKRVEDEKGVSNSLYINSRLESVKAEKAPEIKPRVVYPKDVQEVLDKHRQLKPEEAKVVLDAQLRDALSRSANCSNNNYRILNKRLNGFMDKVSTAEEALKNADSDCYYAKSDKAYDAAAERWDKAKTDIKDYQVQRDRILTQMDSLTSNSEIGPIQADLAVINDYIGSMQTLSRNQ